MKKKNKARSAMSELLSKGSETQLSIEPRPTVQKRTGYIETLSETGRSTHTEPVTHRKSSDADETAYSARLSRTASVTSAKTMEFDVQKHTSRAPREYSADIRNARTAVFPAAGKYSTAEAPAHTGAPRANALPRKQALRTASREALRVTCRQISERADGMRQDVGRVIATHAETGKKAFRFSAKVMRAVVTASILICLCTGIISAVFILNPDDSRITEVAAIGDAYVASTADAPEAQVLTASAEAPADNGRYNVTFTFYQRDSISCTTPTRTVGELVGMLGISLSEDEIMRTDLEQVITADTVVSVDAVSYGTDKSYESIAYETEYVDVQTIPRGTTKIHQNGKNGTKTIEYTVTYVNGVEAERQATGEYISTYPTKCIVYRGVGGTVSIGGVSRSYSYYIDCSTTVYRAGGTTATGAAANENVIAVDPRVIPLGSSCYISGYYTGVRKAADTGGGINGNIIDICFDSDNPMLYSYGRRSSRVYILG